MKLTNPPCILLFAAFFFLFTSCKKTDSQPNKIDAQQDISKSTQANDGIALIGDWEGFSAYNANTGVLIWKYATSPGTSQNIQCESTPCVDGRFVFFNLFDSLYCAELKTGVIRWRMKSVHVRGAISINKGKLYFSYRQGCRCVNAITGKKIWDFRYEAITKEGFPFSSPTIVNNVVYVGGGLDKNLYALNALTGAVIWRSINRGEMCASPCVYNDAVYTTNQVDVFAFNITDGNIKWKRHLHFNIFINPTISNGKLFVNGDSLLCLNPSDGNEIWSFKDAGGNADCFADSDFVYSVLNLEHYYKLDVTNGNVIWAKDYEYSYSGLTVADDKVFFNGIDTGNLYAIESSTGDFKFSTDNGFGDGYYTGIVVVTPTGRVVYPTSSGMRQ